MTSETQHFGLTKLSSGEGVHAGAGRFPTSDRDLIDQQLYAAATHKHTGASAGGAPETAASLSVVSGGTLPADTTIRYVYTYVDDQGQETPGSPEVSIATAAALASPEAPTFVLQSIGGTLLPGQYFYAASRYQGVNTVETKATNTVSVQIPTGSNENQVELTLPSLDGADGFNIYRRGPNEDRYSHIGTTISTSFVDAGEPASARGLPSENTTSADGAVDVTLPGAPPAGIETWKVYRTTSVDWTSSFLAEVPVAQLTYTDIGDGTTFGSPPTLGLNVGAPSKIDLEAEVQGALPVVNGGTGATTPAGARTNLDAQEQKDVLDQTTAAFTTQLKAVVDQAVTTTGDQQIGGTKQFTSKVVVPTPVDPTDAATKAYVDAAGGGGGGGGGTGDLSVDARQNLRLWQLEASVLGLTQDMEGWQGEAFINGQDEVATNNGPIEDLVAEGRTDWGSIDPLVSTDFTALDFGYDPSDLETWLMVGGGNAYRSRDRGETWTSSAIGSAQPIHDLTLGWGWILVGDSVVATSSSGTSWTIRSTPLGTEVLNSVDHDVSTTRAIACGLGGVILAADSDGFTSWTAQTSNVTDDLYGILRYGPIDETNWIAVGDNGTVVMTTDNGATWTEQTTNITNDLRRVVYDGTQFVAIGLTEDATPTGMVATSPDGSTWTIRDTFTSVLTDIHHNEGYGGPYVVVGIGGLIAGSDDAIIWTEEVSNTTDDLAAVAFELSLTGDRWIAVGDNSIVAFSTEVKNPPVGGDVPGLWSWSGETFPNGSFQHGIGASPQLTVIVSFQNIWTSPDGINWTQTRSAVGSNLQDVHYGGGQFIAVGDSGRIMTSPDGLTWTDRTDPGMTQALRRIHYGNGLWMISSTTAILTSPDGITWTQLPTPVAVANVPFLDLIYANGQWVGVNGTSVFTTVWVYSGNVYVSDDDGQTWTTYQFEDGGATTYGCNTVAYGEGRWVIGMDWGGGVQYSDDLSTLSATWTQVEFPTLKNGESYDLEFITYGDGVFVGTSGYCTFAVSEDGSDWTNQYTAKFGSGSAGLEDLVWTGEKWIMASTGSGVVVGEPVWKPGMYIERNDDYALGFAAIRNGNIEPEIHLKHAQQFYGGLEANGVALAHGNSGALQYSLDGKATWNDAVIDWGGGPSGYILFDSVYANGLYLVVGQSGTLLTSPDGINWTKQTSPSTRDFQAAVYAEGLFVVVGFFGAIVTSPDGITWTDRTGVSKHFYGVRHGQDQFVAVGTPGAVFTSPDGVTWTAQTEITTTALYDVDYNDGTWVALGQSGKIFTSSDAVTWTQQTSPTTESIEVVRYLNGEWIAGTTGNPTSAGGRLITSPDGITWTTLIIGIGGTVELPVNVRQIAFSGSTYTVWGWVSTASDGRVLSWLDKEATNDFAILTTKIVDLEVECDSVYLLAEFEAPVAATPSVTVTWEATLNGGGTWEVITPGETTTFTPQGVGDKFAIRVTVERIDPNEEAHVFWFIGYAA